MSRDVCRTVWIWNLALALLTEPQTGGSESKRIGILSAEVRVADAVSLSTGSWAKSSRLVRVTRLSSVEETKLKIDSVTPAVCVVVSSVRWMLADC